MAIAAKVSSLRARGIEAALRSARLHISCSALIEQDWGWASSQLFVVSKVDLLLAFAVQCSVAELGRGSAASRVRAAARVSVIHHLDSMRIPGKGVCFALSGVPMKRWRTMLCTMPSLRVCSWVQLRLCWMALHLHCA